MRDKVGRDVWVMPAALDGLVGEFGYFLQGETGLEDQVEGRAEGPVEIGEADRCLLVLETERHLERVAFLEIVELLAGMVFGGEGGEAMLLETRMGDGDQRDPRGLFDPPDMAENGSLLLQSGDRHQHQGQRHRVKRARRGILDIF